MSIPCETCGVNVSLMEGGRYKLGSSESVNGVIDKAMMEIPSMYGFEDNISSADSNTSRTLV